MSDSSRSVSSSPKQRHRFRALKATIAIALLVALAGGGLYHYEEQADLRARLVRTEPDLIPANRELTRFAIGYARPAYDRNCATCHGPALKGDPILGTPDLTDDDWLFGEGRVAEIERTILHGIRASNGRTLNFADMPAFARPVPYKRYEVEPLGPGEIRDVIMYIFAEAGRPADVEAAKRGAEIFADKGQCFDCHSSDLKGDTAIGAPNLIDRVWLYGKGTYEDVYESVAHGRSGICPAWDQRLSPITIRALAVMIYAASHATPARAASLGSPAPTAG